MEKTVELPAESYRHFKSHLLGFEPFITENRNWMRVDGNNVVHCLLVLGKGESEGVLVNSEGYDYARYASLVPGARELAAAQQKQEIPKKNRLPANRPLYGFVTCSGWAYPITLISFTTRQLSCLSPWVD